MLIWLPSQNHFWLSLPNKTIVSSSGILRRNNREKQHTNKTHQKICHNDCNRTKPSEFLKSACRQNNGQCLQNDFGPQVSHPDSFAAVRAIFRMPQPAMICTFSVKANLLPTKRTGISGWDPLFGIHIVFPLHFDNSAGCMNANPSKIYPSPEDDIETGCRKFRICLFTGVINRICRILADFVLLFVAIRFHFILDFYWQSASNMLSYE